MFCASSFFRDAHIPLFPLFDIAAVGGVLHLFDLPLGVQLHFGLLPVVSRGVMPSVLCVI